MMSSVSTTLCSSWMPVSATFMRRTPSKWNGLVTTPTVRMPSSLAQRATTGAAPVPVPPPMPAVTNTMWAPARGSRISSITSSAAARPTSGCEPAPRPSVTCTPIWMMRSAFDMVRAWASVLATTKSTPSSPLEIMLLTALPPAPPTPNTVMRGLSSRMSGIFRLMLMVASCLRRPWPTGRAGAPPADGSNAWKLFGSSEALAKPSSDPGDVAAGSRHEMPRFPRFEVFEMRRLRIDQEAGRDREGRALGVLRQAADAERPADSYRARENAGGELGQAGELARPAREHDARARLGRERRIGEPVAHHFEDLFHPRLDDAREARP